MLKPQTPWEDPYPVNCAQSRDQNRTREIRPSGIAGRLVETWAMVKANRARKVETLKQPSLRLRLRAPYFYPDQRCNLSARSMPGDGQEYMPCHMLLPFHSSSGPKAINLFALGCAQSKAVQRDICLPVGHMSILSIRMKRNTSITTNQKEADTFSSCQPFKCYGFVWLISRNEDALLKL